MKAGLHFVLTLLLVLISQSSFAQERTVSGTVTDGASFPIPGVNVVIKGTTVSTQTDIDGKFSIQAAANQTLVLSYIGMKTKEVPATTASLAIQMSDEATELEGVVVTALGISRDKKSLGYSAQKIEGSAVNTVPTNNFVNNLSGKVAGLEVRNNSNFGGSTNIVLRGAKSITGNNQALIVLDGVPINNSNLNTASAANSRTGFDFGNSTSDIDPNNIESITVLKGAAATALYGSQASNGAIMITTKKGKTNSGLGVTFSSTTSVGRYNKDTFTKYQKQYGANGYVDGGNDSFSSVDVNGDGINDLLVDTTADASYGNAFDPSLQVYQWTAFAPGNPNFGKPTAWKAAANDPGSFFQDSFGAQNSISANGGDEKTTYNFGFTNNYETGILPNSQLNKNNINTNFSHQLSKKVKVTAFANYTDQTTKGRNNVGYSNNVLGGFRQWWQTNVDIKDLRNAYNVDKKNVTWNMADPLNGDLSPLYWNNPYFDRYQNYQNDDHNRILMGGNVSYDVAEGFNVLARVTVDGSNDRQETRIQTGSTSAEFGLSLLDETSGYALYTRSFLQTTYDVIANYDFRLGSKIGGHALVGTTYIKSKIDSFNGSTTGGLVSPGLFTLANSKSFVAPIETEINYEKQGLYGQLSLDYDKTVYVEGSYRNDSTTALSANNNSYDYYSIGGSFIVSELIKQDWLSLLKLRGSYALVGNDPAAGRLGVKTNNGILNGNLLFTNSTVFADFEKLKPEKQKAVEFGLETSMFNSRLGLDVSVYKTNTTNQIFNVPQSTSTGYSTSQINAGELQNKGIEVSLTGTPIKTNDFSWDVRVNWAKNKNEMVSLNQGRDNLQLASFQDGVSLNATVGQPYGTLRGTGYTLDDNGNRVVGENGLYVPASDKVIGNIQADWIGGVYNRFAYKNIALSVLIDVKKGGDIFSLDQAYGQYTGLYPNTVGNNDLGNPKRNSIADGGGIILKGVNADGTPNTTRIEANYVGSAYGTEARPNQAFVYDASYVKLREVGLTYSFPEKLIEKSAFKNLSVSFLGNNLWIIHKNVPYADPEAGASSGNVQGYQSGVMPSTKVYSINLKASF